MLSEDITARLPRLLKMLEKHNKSIQFYTLKKRLNATDNRDFIELLVSLDPTGSLGKYIEWIAKQAIGGKLRLPEDGPRMHQALTIFNRAKTSPKFKDEKDINKYDFRSLEQAMQQYANLGTEENPQSIREWIKWVESRGHTKFFGDQKFTVLKFENTGKEITVGPSRIQDGMKQNWVPEWAVPNDLANRMVTVDLTAVAVSRLSLGTGWCTNHPQTAASYLRGGPLYAVFRDGQIYILADTHWYQTMNKDDINLSSASPALAYFLAKMVASTELSTQARKTLCNYIEARIKRSEQEGKPIPEKAKQQMLQVTSKVV